MAKNYVEKYIGFTDKGWSATGKTRLWNVREVKQNQNIGELRWYGGFRKYCFFPLIKNFDSLLFDAACMRLIADKLDEVNGRHREMKRRSKMQSVPN